jgi:hypothetical protein
MKAALGCLAVGSVAGIFAFASDAKPAAAEFLFVLGFISGLALLVRDAFTNASNDPARGRLPERGCRRSSWVYKTGGSSGQTARRQLGSR